MEPSKEQLDIINCTSNCVVIAKPGSGKTFTLANKIKKIIPELPDYKGVIAISYTNKASDELKHRSLDGGLERKGSFFGTIDKFFISEIILPFAKYVFGKANKEVEVFSSMEKHFMDANDDKRVRILLEVGYESLLPKHVSWIKEKYSNGIIFLELVGLIALYIFENSYACRSYLKARYSHIIIDEYQDSGLEQHQMFVKLKNLDICSIAVGDGDQSIFGFANKDSRYLLELARTKEESIEVFPLNRNYRCHASIVNYSTAFLNNNASMLPTEEIRVFEKKIPGNQIDIAYWINDNLLDIFKDFNVKRKNKIAILVRGAASGDVIDCNLTIPHKYYQNTPMDIDSNLWSQLFREILFTVFDEDRSKYELVKKYIDISIESREAKFALQNLQKISYGIMKNPQGITSYKEDIIEIAEILIPKGWNKKSLRLLTTVLNSNDMINSYLPAKENQVQLLSIHKSKGLEFDVVFHLDLCQYILPNPLREEDPIQDMNLHYVGITRAKSALFLIWTSKRFNGSGVLKKGIESEFLTNPLLGKLRRPSPY